MLLIHKGLPENQTLRHIVLSGLSGTIHQPPKEPSRTPQRAWREQRRLSGGPGGARVQCRLIHQPEMWGTALAFLLASGGAS